MKLIFSLLLFISVYAADSNTTVDNDNGYAEYCRSEADTYKYLSYYERSEAARQIYKKAYDQNTSNTDNSNNLILYSMKSSYFGLLYTTCLLHLAEKSAESLTASSTLP